MGFQDLDGVIMELVCTIQEMVEELQHNEVIQVHYLILVVVVLGPIMIAIVILQLEVHHLVEIVVGILEEPPKDLEVEEVVHQMSDKDRLQNIQEVKVVQE